MRRLLSLRPRLNTLAALGGTPKYLVRDNFNTALAASAVNGTGSEPGPGMRNVTDTAGSKVLITAGGALQITGTGTWNQAGFWLTPAITRKSGLVVRMGFNGGGTAGSGQLGLTTVADANFTGYNNVSLSRTGANSLAARRTSGPASPTVTVTHDSGTVYLVLRSAGRFVLIDETTDVVLLWDDEWDSTASLYTGATHLTATLAATYDSIAVPDGRYYAVNALASDSFTRADGVLGTTDGAGHLEANSGNGKTWTSTTGTWGIATNAAACSALDGGLGIATVNVGTPHVVVQAEVTRAGDNVGIVARYTDANNYLYAYTDGTNAVLTEVNGGASNSRISAAVTYAAGARLRLTLDGTRAYLHYNELYVNTYTAAGFLATGNLCGLYTTNTGNTFDDFQVWARRGYTDLRSL